MKSRAITVEEYLSELPPDRRRIISQLREIIQDSVPGLMASESMNYGLPMYENHRGKLAFASQKNYISIYMHHADRDRIWDKYQNELGNCQRKKECISYTKISDIDFDVIKKIIIEAYGEN